MKRDKKLTHRRCKQEHIPVVCNVCLKVFTRKDCLKTHMFSRHQKDVISGYKCDICSKAYAKHDRLKRHMISHFGEKQDFMSRNTEKICEICGAIYTGITQLRDHQQKHSDEKLHTCTVCDTSYSSKLYLERHLRMHLGFKQFKCDYNGCSEAYYSKSELWRHKQNHMGNIKKPHYKCIHCCRRFFRPESLEKHYHEKHYDKLTTESSSPLKPYIRDVTKVKSRYRCEDDSCKKNFRTLHSLQYHLITEHIGNEPPFICKGCDETFEERQLLLFHRRFCHSDIKPRSRQCSQCGSCFYTQGALKRHENLVHTDSRPFQCTTCSKSFKTLQSLQGHERTHTGERPYKCDQCDYAAALPSSLRTHKMKHTGEKPFKCELCDFRCRIQPTLRTHMQKHMPPEYVTCEVCGKKLKTKKILNIHMEKMHSSGKQKP